MKWSRALAVSTALAVGTTLCPQLTPEAGAQQLVIATGGITLPAGQVIPLSALFKLATTPNGSAQVVLSGGLTFGDGSQVKSFGSLAIALGTAITANGVGSVEFRASGTNIQGALVSEVAGAQVVVVSPTTARPTTTVPPAPAPPIPGNRPPTATPKSVIAKKNTATAVALKGTDPDGSPLTYSVVDFPENGQLSGRAPNLTYIPGTNFTGTDAFSFSVSDGASTSEPVVVSITVTSTKSVARKVRKKK